MTETPTQVLMKVDDICKVDHVCAALHAPCVLPVHKVYVSFLYSSDKEEDKKTKSPPPESVNVISSSPLVDDSLGQLSSRFNFLQCREGLLAISSKCEVAKCGTG